jgi:hypothetical protein
MKKEEENATDKIIKHLTPTQYIYGLLVLAFTLGGSVYGFFYLNERKNNEMIEQHDERMYIKIRSEVKPLQQSDSIMLELIRSNIVQTKAEEFKSKEIIRYINDPGLTKKIEEQSEIIRAFTEELKKNDRQPIRTNGSTQ